MVDARSVLTRVAVACLLIASVVALSAWAWTNARRARESEVRREAGTLAGETAARVDRRIRELEDVGMALAKHAAVVQGDRESCARLFADVLREQPLMTDLVLNATDGSIHAAAQPVPGGERRILLPYVRQVAESGRPFVSGLTTTQITHKPAIVFAYPVRRADGTVAAVLDVGLELSRLQTLLSASSWPEGSAAALTDRVGLVLARNRDADRYIGTTIEVPAGGGGIGPSPAIQDVDGVEYIRASAAVGDRGWLTIVGIPTRIVAARLRPSATGIVAFASLAVLGVLLLLPRLRGTFLSSG